MISISKAGKLVEVKNIENLYADLPKIFPDATDAQKAQYKTQMEQSFGEKAFRGSFQDDFPVFPGKPVGLNDSWMATTGIESIISFKINTTYTLQSIMATAYQIHGESAVEPSAVPPVFQQISDMPIRYMNFSGNVKSDIELDRVTGWVTQSKVTKLIKGTVEIKDNPTVPGGATFPMTIVADLVSTAH